MMWPLRASEAILVAAVLVQPALWVGIGALCLLAHRLTQLRHELERRRWGQRPSFEGEAMP